MTDYNSLYIKSFRVLIKLFLFAVLQHFVLINTGYSQTNDIQQEIRTRIAQLLDTGLLLIDGEKIAAIHVIPELYKKRNFTPAWEDIDKRNELINIISNIREQGLSPKDYFLQNLQKYHGRHNELTTGEQAEFDILLTESLVRLGYHLRFGKVDPVSLNASWNLDRSMDNENPVTIIQAAINSDSMQAFIDRIIPRQPFYERYKKALADYRSIHERGGWPVIPDGATLKPGMNDPGIELIRKRLQIEGYLAGSLSGPKGFFDVTLEKAVRQFQEIHGLEVDGIVGKQTLEAMNVPVTERIDQIRVNLERGRWVLKDVQGEFLLVNIAGFRAYLVRDNKPVWSTRVIVGRPYRKTPVFKSRMSYLILNPSWTVPPGILRKDILPKVKKDPSYLVEQRMVVLDRDGNQVNPWSLDWSDYTGRNFPYFIRQQPGHDNALGRIKFDFPNQHLVYLHDTPHKELFDKPERTFSSGCIRVEHPYDLAELLLNDSEKWTRQKIEEAIATNKTQTVYLPEPITIMLLYWTVVIGQDGTVHFKKDIYDRDKKLLEAMNRDFSFSLPKDLPEQYYR